MARSRVPAPWPAGVIRLRSARAARPTPGHTPSAQRAGWSRQLSSALRPPPVPPPPNGRTRRAATPLVRPAHSGRPEGRLRVDISAWSWLRR